MNKHKDTVLLIFGYPLNFRHFGGLVWIKKVADYIEKSDSLNVKKVSNYVDARKLVMQRIIHLRAVLEGCLTSPNISILDKYGETTLSMWILLRLFKPSAKIVTVFHHYEPLSLKYKNTNVFAMLYCKLIDYFTSLMLRNSDNILTVSLASSHQLHSILGISNSNKIVVVGCASSDKSSEICMTGPKDLDFLCVGRFEKFDGIEDIWNIIKKENPNSKFVVVGRASSKDMVRLRNMGIDHRGIVSEEEKMGLYSRAKVFIFPSMFEGFGIAITEAFAAGLSVVAWRLPVFEERFEKECVNDVKLVEMGNTALFADEALAAVRDQSEPCRKPSRQHNLRITKTWDEVGKDVMSVLNKIS
jgi:glycosyltransferase involved in cell wall biosynthesis